MRILVWHRHGSWLTSFLQGRHEYLIPVLPDRSEDGAGRADTWDWPVTAVERSPAELDAEQIDVVVLQQFSEIDLVERWTGRRPGRDLPAVFVEHNTPAPFAVASRHPLADRRDIPIAHVTPFNAVFWDNGLAPTRVIEHGLPDPGLRFTGSQARGAVVGNHIARRGRTVGADLLDGFAAVGPVDVFGMAAREVKPLTPERDVGVYDELPDQQAMFDLISARRVYLHLCRWTSLGLSLLEALFLGLPVVALASTDAINAVPPGAGVISTDLAVLHSAMARLLADPEAAARAGRRGREHAVSRYGLDRFLAEWDALLEVVA